MYVITGASSLRAPGPHRVCVSQLARLRRRRSAGRQQLFGEGVECTAGQRSSSVQFTTYVGSPSRHRDTIGVVKAPGRRAHLQRRRRLRRRHAFLDGVAAGDAASSLVDGGRGTTLSRRRLVGAKTPWNRVRFAYVGGMRGTSFSSSSTPVITSCRRPSGSARFMSYAKRPSGSSVKRDDATAPRAP